MTHRFDWRDAFAGQGVTSNEQRRAVREAINEWNEGWNWDTDQGYFTRVEDENCDGIWDVDYDDADDVNSYFPSDFVEYMDHKFLGKAKSTKPIIIGKATKLPIPGSRPSHS